jgi:ribosomal protein S18 acetylase RimI-like enzyme
MSALDIRPASAAEFAVAVEWAAAEGWNPGLDDLPAFHAADPGGFFLGWIDGRPVSSISVVRYGKSFGFLGFYIVRPDHRGGGAGLATWNHGMAYLAGCTTVGLDGVMAQQANYRKSGFVLAGRNVRHSGAPALPASGLDAVAIRAVTAGDLPAVRHYDRAFFPAPRDSFVNIWAQPDSLARRTALIAAADGGIVGYGVIRACRSGHKIGPLFADDAATAEALFVGLCRTVPGEAVSLDTPEGNQAAVGLARRFGLQPVFETARMYRGPAPTLPVARTYGITTFELG